MATRKKAGAKGLSRKTKVSGSKKTAARRVRTPRSPKTPAARAQKARRAPETLRLKSISPSLTVSDLGKSLVFYTEALGFFAGESWTEGDLLRGVMLNAGSCELGLTQDDWKQGRDRKKGIGFRIWCDTSQDVDSLAARVKALGFALTEEPRDHPAWGVRCFAVDDPDGFHITIARRL
jgi:catechol 2,3-dioxygenase-like lactoylglutathione lyase family enzyme